MSKENRISHEEEDLSSRKNKGSNYIDFTSLSPKRISRTDEKESRKAVSFDFTRRKNRSKDTESDSDDEINDKKKNEGKYHSSDHKMEDRHKSSETNYFDKERKSDPLTKIASSLKSDF